jgi:type IV pilus assembly protein PilB
MSAGFFGSFFKRSNEEDARASRPVHSAVDEAPAAEETHVGSSVDTAEDQIGGRIDNQAAAQEVARTPVLPRTQPVAEQQVQQPVQQPAALSPEPQTDQFAPVRTSEPPPRHRLDWLKDLMDEEEAEDQPASRQPEKSAWDHDLAGSFDEDDAADNLAPDHEPDPREPDFYRDSILEDDHYPLKPIETVGEVDFVAPLKSPSVSGDGFRESSVPEARYTESPPPPIDLTPPFDLPPVDASEVSEAGEGVAAEADSDKPEAAPEATIPDAPVDDVLIEQIKRKDRVVAMLLRKEIVSPQQVANAQQKREQGGKETLWRVLATLKTVDSEAVYAEAARVYAFREVVLGEGGPDVDFARSVMDTFPEELRDRLIQLRVLPFAAEMEKKTGAIKLVFVTHDPTRPEMHKVMQELKLERFELRYAPEGFVRAFIAEAFPRKNEYLERMSEGSMRYDLGASFDDKSSLIDEDALEAEINRSSLINLFEATLVEAVRRGASDIHIYPNADKHIEVHFRVDGRLGIWHTEQKVHPEALLAVIKDNAMNVDRFERDSAQDGFIQRWIDDALIRFRVSVLPIANAVQEMRSESIVIRVLDDRKVITDLRTLGLLDTALERFEMAIRQPHGMVILTGPTGSGKSTTLVAAMHQVVTPEVNVLTVEDPVEYIIPGVRQIKLNHKLGLEEALRAILRHDPDVVMVGEMRDRQTADLAIKLANTGHLTFSTLHTNDAPSAVSRLFKMGIEPFLIAYAINMVVAQRLIRTLCKDCKRVDDDPDEVMLKKLGFTEEDIATKTIYRTGDNPKCKSCKGTSYKGRRAVTEALYFSRPIRHLIVEAQNMIDEESIRQAAVKEGMLTLKDSAREIVKMGETSITEMIRVVTTDH